MNNFERFRALVSVIESNNLTWKDLIDAGITKDMYSELEAAHMKEIENGTAKDNPEAFEAYRKEFALKFR